MLGFTLMSYNKEHLLKSACLAFFAGFLSWGSLAQAPFVDVSNEMDIWTEHIGGYLGEGMSMADFNGDGYDDLSIAHHLGDLHFYLGNGVNFIPVDLDLPIYPHEAKCILWADIDNDGDYDLFITYRLAANKLYINEGDFEFTDVSALCGIDQSNRRSYGACFGDYNNDGLLDLFIANYVSGQDPPYNELYRNIGDGYFIDVTFNGPFGEPLDQSFQGNWVDFDEDGLLDLHLIRDRICFDNRYYKQGENGEFFDDAPAMNLDYSVNAMCTSTTDFDHDNDQDLYMSAGLWEGNYFVINDGTGEFSDYEAAEGDSVEVHLTSWAANWLDVDNDGWEDLHVCTSFSTYTSWPAIFATYPYVPDNFFWNQGGYFEEDSTGFFDVQSLSFCAVTGDFNHDGFPDLVSNIVGEYAQVLKAVPNNNNWIKIMLEGTESNRDGIGSKIRVYRNGLIGYHMTECGGNYLGQNSRWEHFGLGLATGVDSVVVTWPSGIIDHYENLEPNQHYAFIEGETIPVFDPCASEPCPGCTYEQACNYDVLANEEDGSCDFSCWIAEIACGSGTQWDATLQQCVLTTDSCPTDLNDNGVTDIADLLIFLASFASSCL